jgi:hypothetical protein
VEAPRTFPNPNQGCEPMVEANRSLPYPSTIYWVDVILTTAWERRRFDCERRLSLTRRCMRVCQTHVPLRLTPLHPKAGGSSSSSGAKQRKARAKHGNHADREERSIDLSLQPRTPTRREPGSKQASQRDCWRRRRHPARCKTHTTVARYHTELLCA